jgi:23S rRNA (cytosine1962-C5)-methyltransferase
MALPQCSITGGRRRLKQGHLWIFRDEIAALSSDTIEAGDLVRVVTDYGYDCGIGFYHPESQIAVRLLRHSEDDITVDFFIQRLENARAMRQHFFHDSTAYRLCFGESDFLPGLIIDRYDTYFALQILSAGMEKCLPLIVEALQKVFPDIQGIIEKNDSRIRELEGLPRREGILWGTIPAAVRIMENDIKLDISLEHGQKTGYFFDQRYNRAAIATIAKNLRVLDCFTNQGGFALNAAKAGAAHCVGVDISQTAIDASIHNAMINSLTNTEFIKADVFTLLKQKAQQNEKWDMVILDPPAFTKSKHTVPQAKRGYADINRQALRLINNGGYLVSSSCSHHISEEIFYSIIHDEAQRINRRLQLVWRGQQSPDHPILLGMPETQYLKFFVFRVW